MTHLEPTEEIYTSRPFESLEKAVEYAERANRRLDAMDPSERSIVGWLAIRYPDCIACGEFTARGRAAGCSFEKFTPVQDNRGIWRLARTRCMLRSWVEHLATGVDPNESRLGTVNEYREDQPC